MVSSRATVELLAAVVLCCACAVLCSGRGGDGGGGGPRVLVLGIGHVLVSIWGQMSFLV